MGINSNCRGFFNIEQILQLENWKRLLSFDQMRNETGPAGLGTEFIGLLPMVQEKLGSDFQIIQGHRCHVNGREYVHLILTRQKNVIVSLVITRKNSEAFTRAEAIATIEASGVPVYTDTQDQLEIAGFESSHFLAFVVSNLDRPANLKLASALAPAVYQHLSRL